MATLYLARRSGARGFARHLAIKVVNEDLAQDDVFVEMFIDEANLAAQINHPNVVHVEDFGEADGNYFIAMEYVHGCSLAQLLRALIKQKRRLAPELAVHIALKIAEGLHAAHEATDRNGEPLNVVHRDVNPANVLLDFRGHVKLIDFGIAKSTSRAHQTTGGSLKGKLRYMSPEQAMGKAIDRRADIYSLGITLWEILTARRLFDAETDIQVLESVRNPNIEPPSRHAEDITAELDAVVMSTLNPAPEARTSTALELRKQLTRVMPEGAMLDASSLSELISVVMREQIEKRKAKLPESMAGGAKISKPADEDEVLRTMTVSDIDLELGENQEQTSVSNSIPGDPAPPPDAPKPAATPPKAAAMPPKGAAMPPKGVPFTEEFGATTPDSPAAPDTARPEGAAIDPVILPQSRLPLLIGVGAIGALLLGSLIAALVVTASDDSTETEAEAANPPTIAVIGTEAEAEAETETETETEAEAETETEAEAETETEAEAEADTEAETETDSLAGNANVDANANVNANANVAATSMRRRRTTPRMTTMTMQTTPPAMMRRGAPSLVNDVF